MARRSWRLNHRRESDAISGLGMIRWSGPRFHLLRLLLQRPGPDDRTGCRSRRLDWQVFGLDYERSMGKARGDSHGTWFAEPISLTPTLGIEILSITAGRYAPSSYFTDKRRGTFRHRCQNLGVVPPKKGTARAIRVFGQWFARSFAFYAGISLRAACSNQAWLLNPAAAGRIPFAKAHGSICMQERQPATSKRQQELPIK